MSTAEPGCLAPFLRLLGIHPTETSDGTVANGPLPYRINENFLSLAELSFYRVLSLAIGDEGGNLPQAGLGAIFFVPKAGESFYGHWNRIAAKRVDFPLCDPTTMRPLAGIELDDASHKADARQERDAFVEEVFEAACLPLLRFPARSTYAPADLAAQISAALLTDGLMQTTAVEEDAADADSAPICPKCGIAMVMRTSHRGDRAGQQF
jgi:hypothetical protein